MRRVLIILWLVLLGEAIAAQPVERGTLTHYTFPAFTTGELHKKDGEIVKANLNYKTLTDEFGFDENGQKLALDHLEAIERVELENRSFIPVEKAFAKW